MYNWKINTKNLVNIKYINIYYLTIGYRSLWTLLPTHPSKHRQGHRHQICQRHFAPSQIFCSDLSSEIAEWLVEEVWNVVKVDLSLFLSSKIVAWNIFILEYLKDFWIANINPGDSDSDHNVECHTIIQIWCHHIVFLTRLGPKYSNRFYSHM